MNLDDFARDIKQKYNLKEFRLYFNQYGDIILDMIASNVKNQGDGSSAMLDLVNLADKYNKKILLTTGLKDDRWGTTSKNRLIKFYKRFGFVENKGRNKDFSTRHNMIRIPKKIIKEKLSFKKFLLKEVKNSDTYEQFNKNLKLAGNVVDGLIVREKIDNLSSISSSLEDYKILPNLREMSMGYFTIKNIFYAENDWKRSRILSEKIKKNGEITPLIVIIDDEGPYILEGIHRLVALHYLNKKSFPALVVIDMSENNEQI